MDTALTIPLSLHARHDAAGKNANSARRTSSRSESANTGYDTCCMEIPNLVEELICCHIDLEHVAIHHQIVAEALEWILKYKSV